MRDRAATRQFLLRAIDVDVNPTDDLPSLLRIG